MDRNEFSRPRAWLALRQRPSGVLRYIVSVTALAVAVLFRYAFWDLLGPEVPYLQFYPAVMVAAWYGGLGPGLMATGGSALLAMYSLLPPDGLAASDPPDQLSLAVFVVTGLVISWLNDRLHQAREVQREMVATADARAERLDAILNTTVDGIIVIDSKGLIEAFNHSAEELFGYPASEVLGRNVSVLMPSPHHEQHDRYLEHYLTTGEARIIGGGRQVTGRRRDGTLIPVHLSVGEMHIGGQRKFTGLLHDLTKRMHLEGQLGASEARWRAVIDSAVDGIIVIDQHGHVEAFNPAAARLFGYDAQEVLGRNVNILMPSPYHEEHDAYLSRYLATGRTTIIGVGREVQGRRKDGSTFPLHLSVGEITIDGERKFTGILHDLSARVQMEERLREQAALARLGEMAAVVAHEVKNPLAGIRGAIQVVGSRMPPESPSSPILKEIVTRIDALDQMMKDLLLFARPPAPRRAPSDILPLIAKTADLLRADPALGDVEIELTGASPPVPVDSEMLKIVFHNLLINGAHAINGRGRIRVAVTADNGFCNIAFSDPGPGIAKELLDKIFVPFFTTKARGSGLGLPTAKRLIEAHGGQIAIECPPAGGTTVVVRVPLVLS